MDWLLSILLYIFLGVVVVGVTLGLIKLARKGWLGVFLIWAVSAIVLIYILWWEIGLPLLVILLVAGGLAVLLFLLYLHLRKETDLSTEAQIAAAVAIGVAVLVIAYLPLRWIGAFGPSTPAPPASITDASDLAQRAAVLEYARSLTFDEHTHGASDIQFLDQQVVNDDGTTVLVPGGPLGAIYPEKNIHRTSTDKLFSGRIISKVWVEADYPKLGMKAGWNYVWIEYGEAPAREHGPLPVVSDSIAGIMSDRLRPTTREWPVAAVMKGDYDNEESLRAIIIPDNLTDEAEIRSAEWYSNENAGFYRAFSVAKARWGFSPNDNFGWMTCKHGCCVVKG